MFTFADKTREKYEKMSLDELIIECKKYRIITKNKTKKELIVLLKLYL